jgi:hypothetical protein
LSSAAAPGRKQPEVTKLLLAWQAGNESALDQLVALVEAELLICDRQAKWSGAVRTRLQDA